MPCVLIFALKYLPVADPSMVNTCTVISVDDELLRTSTGCAGPASSLTLYVDWLNLTVNVALELVGETMGRKLVVVLVATVVVEVIVSVLLFILLAFGEAKQKK